MLNSGFPNLKKLVESIVIDKFKYGSKVTWLSIKATDSTKKVFSISKYIKKSRIYTHTSLKRAIIEDIPSRTMCSMNSNGI